MRFKNIPYPTEYELRIFKRFLIFPCRIQNETRWMETAYIERKYIYVCASFSVPGWFWSDARWATKEEYIRQEKELKG